MSPDWYQRRTRLHHDWLKNEFLKRLDEFIVELGSPAPNLEVIVEFLRDQLPRWRQREPELKRLLDESLAELSPASLFGREPLDRCSPELAAMLAPLADALWRVREPAEEVVRRGLRSLTAASGRYANLADRLDAATAVKNRGDLLPDLERFADDVLALSRAIHVLPRRERCT